MSSAQFSLCEYTLAGRFEFFYDAGVTIEKKSGFLFAGISARTSNSREMSGNGDIGRLWHQFMGQNLAAQIPHHADEDIVAMYTGYEGDEKDEYTFLIGKRVSSLAAVPPPFVTKEVAESRYAIFTSEKGPLAQVVPKAWQQIWTMTAEELGGKRSFTIDFEVYGANAQDPDNGQVDLFVAIV